jgi:serine/threonine protein kinase/WD40 repeat protein
VDVDQSCQEFPEHSPEVFDFLSEYLDDVESGETHGVDHYVKRFPGSAAAIRKEFEALTSAGGPVVELDTRLGSRVGPYELLSEIGRGGQGVVYLAEDSRIARQVALKVLPPAALLFSDSRRQRLQREAEVISRLAHPGICGIFDADMDGEFAYIAMPVIEGETLAAAIATREEAERGEALPRETTPGVRPDTPQEFQSLLQFFERAARALHSAHEAGVVHRDVKPGNLMVTPDGSPVWLDFGQARDAQTSGVDLTLSGEIFGTPAYMSPEQVCGGTIDARTDVWALSVSLFEALTLRRPFEGATAHVLMLSIKNDHAPDVREFHPGVSRELAITVATGLERESARRYASAQDLADDLARLQVHEPIRAQAAGKLLRLRRWSEKHPALAMLAIAMFVALIVSTRLVLLKDAALDVALGRHLAGRSEELMDSSPASALLLAIQAVEKAPDAMTRMRLYGALDACYLRSEFEAGDDGDFLDVMLVPGGTYVAGVLLDGEVALYERLSGKRVRGWTAHAPGEDRKLAEAYLAVSADGALLASGGEDGKVVVAGVEGDGTKLTFDGPGGGIVELLFGADGKTLLVRGRDGGLALYNAGERKQIRVVDSEATERSYLALDSLHGYFYERPSGIGAEFSRVLLDDQTGEPIHRQAAPPESADWAQWSPRGWVWLTGRRLTWRSPSLGGEPHDGTGPVHILSAEDAEEPVASIALSGSAEHILATIASEGGMRCFVLNLETSATVPLEMGFTAPPKHAVFSRDENRLALVGPNSRLLIFDCLTGKLITEGIDYLRAEYLQWTADGQFVFARQHRGPQAQLWYATNRPDLYTLDCGKGAVVQAEFAGDGERAFTLTANGDLRLWETPGTPSHGDRSGALVADLTRSQFPMDHAKFAPGRTQLLAWGARGAQSWDAKTAAQLHRSSLQSSLRSLDANDALDTWLMVDFEGRVWIERLATQNASRVGEQFGPAQLVSFVPGREVFLTGHDSGVLCAWDSASLELVWETSVQAEDEETGSFVEFAFSPGAEQVAVAWSEWRIHFRNIVDGREARESLAVIPPTSLDWSADGRRLVISGSKGRGAFRVEDLEPPIAGKGWMRAEELHGDNLTGACFSPDGSLALSMSLDGTVMIRDVLGAANPRSTVLQSRLDWDGGAVHCADFSRGVGPLRVIAGLENGTARIWPVDPLSAAIARRPRQKLKEWEFAREQRFAAPLDYR